MRRNKREDIQYDEMTFITKDVQDKIPNQIR